MVTSRSLSDPTETSLRGHIRSWLASWDFVDNPFGLWEAGREPWLDRYFVRRPFFEQLLNDPKSTLVFAPRGGGKSATRVMVEAECRPTIPTSSVFAVSFTDFSPFVESYYQPARLTLADYLPHLIAIALPRVLAATARIPVLTLDSDSVKTGELRHWLDHYAPHTLTIENLRDLLRHAGPGFGDERLTALATRIQRGSPLPTGLSGRMATFARFLDTLRSVRPVAPSSPMASPSQVMQVFVQLVLELLRQGPTPCDTFYLLVDGVDEYALTQDDPNTSADLLRPLLGNVHFLELPGFAVKFFLPAEQRSVLERIARLDRLDVITLTWDPPRAQTEPDYLRQLLRRRITAFNTRGLVSLGELCAPAMRHWIEDAMLEEAHDSPRNVIRLGDLLFAEHCRDLPEPESVLLPAEWERALVRFRATVLRESPVRQGPLLSVTMPSPTPPPSAIPLLRVDSKSGRVFRGNEELPPLTDLEYRLLAFLYRRQGQICIKYEIVQAVYEPKYDKIAQKKPAGVSDEAISHLVYRLRQRIEPPGRDKPVYVKTIRGRGYRLDNAA